MNAYARPSELAREYLEREFLNGTSQATRLPPIGQLAQKLKISPNTVRTVIRELTAEGKLQTTQGRGVFITRPSSASAPRSLLLAVNLPSFDPAHPSGWGQLIYMGAARTAFNLNRNISVLPIDSGAEHQQDDYDASHQILRERIDEIDMLLLFPFGDYQTTRDLYETAGKPVITVNSPTLISTGNFVSADFYSSSFRVGRSWYESGRRNFYCVGPVFSPRYSSSMQLFFQGFSEGCGRDFDPEVRFRILNIGLNATQEELSERLTLADDPPDAIFCMGDIVGSRILSLIRDAGFSVPDQISIVSGTGHPDDQLAYPELTRIMQPMEQIGAQAVQMLCHRLDHDNAPLPGCYIPTPVNHGGTTRPEENQRLQTLFESSSTYNPIHPHECA